MKLRVGSAIPDPPFESYKNGTAAGLDIELTQAIAREIGRDWELVPYDGDNFEGIFEGLGTAYDLVASGTTATPKREAMARFCTPYLRSGQSLVVNVEATPNVTNVDALTGLRVGIQKGNTSQIVAERLLSEGKIADIAWYAYHDIGNALDDLEAARIGAIIKLEPVMHALTQDRPKIRVVQAGLTDELIAYCVALGDETLAAQVNAAQEKLRSAGTLDALVSTWCAGLMHTELYR